MSHAPAAIRTSHSQACWTFSKVRVASAGFMDKLAAQRFSPLLGSRRGGSNQRVSAYGWATLYNLRAWTPLEVPRTSRSLHMILPLMILPWKIPAESWGQNHSPCCPLHTGGPELPTWKPQTPRAVDFLNASGKIVLLR